MARKWPFGASFPPIGALVMIEINSLAPLSRSAQRSENAGAHSRPVTHEATVSAAWHRFC